MTVQVDSFRDLLHLMSMDRVPNAQMKEMSGMTKEVDEKIDESVLR